MDCLGSETELDKYELMNLWLGRKNYGTSIFNPDQTLTIVCKEYLLYIIFVM